MPSNDGDGSVFGTGHVFRDALRLLFLLVAGADRRSEDPDWSGIFVGEKRLMALDFLVRYPDYLADALLDMYEDGRRAEHLAAAEAIFDADEPDVRLVSMIRWRRGAFQNIETAVAVLDARGLVRAMKRDMGERKRFEFLVSRKARHFLEGAVASQPALGWYRDRTELVMSVAGGRSGTALKDDQYEHREYRDAPFGAPIPSIKGRVLARIERLRRSGG